MAKISIKSTVIKSKTVKRLINAALNASTTKSLSTLKSYTPVKTGKLRDGWDDYSNLENSIIIYNDVSYLEYVDAGSRGRVPANIVEKSLPIIESYFTKAVEGVIGKLN